MYESKIESARLAVESNPGELGILAAVSDEANALLQQTPPDYAAAARLVANAGGNHFRGDGALAATLYRYASQLAAAAYTPE